MPAICKCQVPGCTFKGNHGFNSTVGGVIEFYHTLDKNNWRRSTGNTHWWYSGTLPDGKPFVTTDKLEVFEKCVVPRALFDSRDIHLTQIWIQAYRARLHGHERKAKKLFEQWRDGGLGTSKARR